MNGTKDAVERVLTNLNRTECLALLGTASVGRLAYCFSGSPRIEVVNFILDGPDPIFRIGRSTKLAITGAGGSFALQVDRLNEFNRTGWSVTVVGRATRLEDADIDRLTDQLEPWAPGDRPWFVRLNTGHIFGRRLSTVPGVIDQARGRGTSTGAVPVGAGRWFG